METGDEICAASREGLTDGAHCRATRHKGIRDGKYDGTVRGRST